MAQAILGLKAAADKATARNPKAGEAEITAALVGLSFEAPSGTVRMAIGKGHQAIQEMVYGQFKLEGGKPVITRVVRYPAECVNPPDGTTSKKWIESGFPGAKCK